jgi:hypothetical protein
MQNVISLHRRLDRLDDDEGPSIAEALEQAQRAHEARQATWNAAGHPGAPPHKQLPPPRPNAPHAERELWRKIAQGTARVIYGKDAAGSPFATLQAAYALDDEALLVAINSHPLYGGTSPTLPKGTAMVER